MFKLELLTAPTVEPITTDDAKTHARVFDSSSDDYIDGLISAARQKFETESGFYLSEAEYKLTTRLEFFNRFNLYYFGFGFGSWFCHPNGHHLVLPLRPVFQVESVNSLVLDTDYEVSIDAMTGICTIHFLTSVPNDIVVTFKVGSENPADGGDSTAPALAKHALKSLVSHWFENREAYQAGSSIKSVPATYQSILTTYRLA